MIFTVFTPTYNRGNLLYRVFDSLKAQTFKNFEWVVVDDGSTDNSQLLIEDFIKEVDFPCRLFIQPRNMGKHIAWNLAVQEAKGELFIVADSDDAFTPESLNIMYREWMNISEVDRKSFAGINVLCQDSTTGSVVGDLYPTSPFDSNALELAYVHRIKGEKWGCVRTELLKKVPFPDTAGSHFAENYIWMTLARKYKTRCINETLRIFFDDQRPDRLTQERRASSSRTKFEAAYEWNATHLNMNADYVMKAPKELIITVANLGRASLILGKTAGETAAKLYGPALKTLFWLSYPLAYFLYRRDIFRGRVQ